MDWTDAKIEELTRLWNDGVTTNEIGRIMKISKNAAVGKAGRLGLASRPSPIIRDGRIDPREAERRRLIAQAKNPPKNTLPPLGSPEMEAAPVRWLPSMYDRPAPVRERKPPTHAAPPKPVPAPVYRRTTECCWPIGHPREKTFRMCDKVTAPGKSYCLEHCSLAYVRVRKSDENVTGVLAAG